MKKRTNRPKLYRVVTMKRWGERAISEYTYTIPAMSKAQALRCDAIGTGEVVMSVDLIGYSECRAKVWIPKPCTP